MKERSVRSQNGIEISRSSQEKRITLSGEGVEIRREGKPISLENRLIKADIVFIIDTTGSMSDEIEGLMQTCQKFAKSVVKKNIDHRMGIIAFGDLTISPPDKMFRFPLIRDADRISRAFAEILTNHRTSGGGNLGESSIDALWRALEGFEFRQEATRVFLLFSDEPPLEPDTKQRSMNYTIQEFKRHKIVCFSITIPDDRFKRLAKETGGSWFAISRDINFLSILDQLFARVIKKVVEIALKLPQDSAKPAIENGR
ncbi:MAG: vWA domain-containing protein [Candidatus Zixiibacteriota bacterium]